MIDKGHESPSIATSLVSNGMGPFALAMTRKSERLATALYLVTNFLPDNEPLKARLRTLALELVRTAMLVKYGTTSDEVGAPESLRGIIAETLGLLELAFINGLVSEMNFSILKREYVVFRDAVEIKKASRESRTDTVLSESFFGTSLMGRQRTSDEILRTATNGATENSSAESSQGHSIGHHKGHDIIKDTVKDIKMSDRKTEQKNDVLKNNLKHVRPQYSIQQKIASITSNKISSVQIEARHTRILKLIKGKRDISIKDIIEHFPEISEKTIQRDLVAFTESGVLKKSGDRRWSRYSIA